MQHVGQVGLFDGLERRLELGNGALCGLNTWVSSPCSGRATNGAECLDQDINTRCYSHNINKYQAKLHYWLLNRADKATLTTPIYFWVRRKRS